MKYAIHVGAVLVIGQLAAFGDPASENLKCPTVDKESYPALVFVGEATLGTGLHVARFTNGSVRCEEIVSAISLGTITQLNNTVLLAEASDRGRPRTMYAFDLAKGIRRALYASTGTLCLRAAPARGKAMLMKLYSGIHKADLIELDLATLDTTLRYTLAGEFGDLRVHARLSPDFKRIAYMAVKDPIDIPTRSNLYALRVLDLSAMTASDLDSDVRVEIQGRSSFGYGTPPCEWVNDDEILYQHIPADPEKEEGRHLRPHVLKIVSLKTGRISEFFRQELPLTLDGGRLRTHPLNGKILFREHGYPGQWVVDVSGKRLVPKNEPFAIERDYARKETRILDQDGVLYSGTERCVHDLISPSGKHFAYALRPPRRPSQVTLFAKIAGRPQPIKVIEDYFSAIRPVAWIE